MIYLYLKKTIQNLIIYRSEGYKQLAASSVRNQVGSLDILRRRALSIKMEIITQVIQCIHNYYVCAVSSKKETAYNTAGSEHLEEKITAEILCI